MGRILLSCLLLVGPAILYLGIRNEQRDRPSLQWPKVSGTIVQSDWTYHPGRHPSTIAHVDYTYRVNGQFFAGNTIKLWDPQLEREGRLVEEFVRTHPVGSAVDVYYDPAHSEMAALIPGADEFGYYYLTWSGGILCGLALLAWFRSRRFFAEHIAAAEAKEAALAVRPESEKAPGLPHAFASYEPGSPQKLNCFPDRDCLRDELGQEGTKSQDWQPDDRIIDVAGKEYRLVRRPDGKAYNIEPTGETWDCERLLDVAEADAKLVKKDPIALRRLVEESPPERRMAVLMHAIDDLSSVMSVKDWLAQAGVVLFLVLFFGAFAFGVAILIYWLTTLIR